MVAAITTCVMRLAGTRRNSYSRRRLSSAATAFRMMTTCIARSVRIACSWSIMVMATRFAAAVVCRCSRIFRDRRTGAATRSKVFAMAMSAKLGRVYRCAFRRPAALIACCGAIVIAIMITAMIPDAAMIAAMVPAPMIPAVMITVMIVIMPMMTVEPAITPLVAPNETVTDVEIVS